MPTNHRSHRRVALTLLGVCLPALAFGQDLAALAKKEKSRRAKVTKPVKVLTEEDGKEAATKGTGSFTVLPGEALNTAPPGTDRAPGTEGESPEAQRAAWKARGDAARAAVAGAESNLTQMERALEAYRSDMAPVSAADAQDPMRLQKREARMFEMTKEIEAQKTAVADAKKALSALEDEARAKGVPPGWLR